MSSLGAWDAPVSCCTVLSWCLCLASSSVSAFPKPVRFHLILVSEHRGLCSCRCPGLESCFRMYCPLNLRWRGASPEPSLWLSCADFQGEVEETFLFPTQHHLGLDVALVMPKPHKIWQSLSKPACWAYGSSPSLHGARLGSSQWWPLSLFSSLSFLYQCTSQASLHKTPSWQPHSLRKYSCKYTSERASPT